MAKLTIAFGVVLIALGVCAYFLFAQQSHGIHSLIPAVFGLLLVVLGTLANTPVAKKRMLFMHIAVTVGLLGFLGTIPGLIGVVQMASGHVIARPEAAKVQAVMGQSAWYMCSFVCGRLSRQEGRGWCNEQGPGVTRSLQSALDRKTSDGLRVRPTDI